MSNKCRIHKCLSAGFTLEQSRSLIALSEKEDVSIQFCITLATWTPLEKIRKRIMNLANETKKNEF